MFITVLFIMGLYLYSSGTMKEGFDGFINDNNDSTNRCPNLLIQKGNRFYLHNTEIAQVPGVNPVEFNSLEEYTQFLKWQRSNGIRCSVLYLQQTYNAQGQRAYTVRPSATNLEGGLPPSSTTLPFPLKKGEVKNLNNIQNINPPLRAEDNMDKSSYYMSSKYPLDKTNNALNLMKQSEQNMLYSDNAMDPNWGGAEYTQALVDTGFYKENEVQINV